jgi:molybdopterin synthase catalytic subunit
MIQNSNDDIIIQIQEEKIDVGELISKMKSNNAGALSIFLGKNKNNKI